MSDTENSGHGGAGPTCDHCGGPVGEVQYVSAADGGVGCCSPEHLEEVLETEGRDA